MAVECAQARARADAGSGGRIASASHIGSRTTFELAIAGFGATCAGHDAEAPETLNQTAPYCRISADSGSTDRCCPGLRSRRSPCR